MRFVVQRVLSSSVEVDGLVVGEIGKGLMVLVGISEDDTKEIADKMLKKLLALRIFEDENGKTNLNISSVAGSLLLVSQFTLYSDMSRGNRPSFDRAGRPEMAGPLYDYLLQQAKKKISVVEKGVFGAGMRISLINDGPFTVFMDSDELFK